GGVGVVGEGGWGGLAWGRKGNVLGITGTGAGGSFWDISIPPGSNIGPCVRTQLDAGMDYFNGTMYNIQGNIGASSLYRINTSTGAPTLIGSNSFYFGDLAIDELGIAYATDSITTDSLYRINLSNGAATLVGPLNLGNISNQWGTSFSADGTLWALADNGDMFTVDTSSGTATRHGHVTIG